MNKLSLILCFSLIGFSLAAQNIVDKAGAIVRSDTSVKTIYLCFTGHDQIDGFDHVVNVLNNQKVKASFFLTGDFVRSNEALVKDIAKRGHYVGVHSDKHLLYCDWNKRDSLLHSESEIKQDISDNIVALERIGIPSKYFMPPYEWYNQKVVEIASQLNQITVNFSSGTRSNADYTTPDMPNYLSSEQILKSIDIYQSSHNMNGFHLLIHPGTSPERKDKFYVHLEKVIDKFREQGYQFLRF